MSAFDTEISAPAVTAEAVERSDWLKELAIPPEVANGTSRERGEKESDGRGWLARFLGLPLASLDREAAETAADWNLLSPLARARWGLKYHARRCHRGCVLSSVSREDILCRDGGRLAHSAGLSPAKILRS